MKQNLFADIPGFSTWRNVQIASVIFVVMMCTLPAPIDLIDDAYITFRHSYNLAHHQQLAFNLGENVEAQTNLLWSLVIAPATLTDWPIEHSVLWLSISCLIWGTIRLTQIGKALDLTPLMTLIAVGLVIGDSQFIRTATNGLEAPLYSALISELFYRYVRKEYVASFLAAGLLFATRPEGAIFGVLIAAAGFWSNDSRTRIFKGLLCWLAILTTICTFRYATYGSVLPNSVIAKSLSISQIFESKYETAIYILSFMRTELNLVLLTGLAITLMISKKELHKTHRYLPVICISVIAVTYLIAVRNAGDWMPDHRLMTQYGVVYGVLMLWVMTQPVLDSVSQPKMMFFLFGTIAGASFLNSAASMEYRENRDVKDFYTNMGQRLSRVVSDHDTISAEALGEISYRFIRNKFHDPIGLADAYLARHGTPSPTFGKEDVNYTLGKIRPSVLLWHWAGHLKRANSELLGNYEIRCVENCNMGWKMRLVMIRKDRFADIGPSFSDLPVAATSSETISIVAPHH